VYALTVHSRSTSDAPRLRWIVLSAVDTTSMSRITMKEASELSASTQRWAGLALRVGVVVAVCVVTTVKTPAAAEFGLPPVS